MLLAEPLEAWLFDLWWAWLAEIFRFDATESQCAAYLSALRERRFTNKDVILAGRWFEENNYHFPFVAGWLQCPDIPRNSERPNTKFAPGNAPGRAQGRR